MRMNVTTKEAIEQKAKEEFELFRSRVEARKKELRANKTLFNRLLNWLPFKVVWK